ncbi:putative efflux pump antibiotic resistance protein [Aspergillus pseudonomiae]|uniref:Putative efflux pump antibiotic resistance protein n=1 Tax=Aspergillus pseudonomiae TaxID=1506151 RepID=A0A5N7DPH6_9EURO|nr:putative efflux pump antibiotic resistance protein [Aspergillus pseudonomiae]KAB8259413.1 putative efflux pump antibiotic resistance protein [Aspergillus pseudonomiae]KAE8408334.1 putative efflux pump antibiotic resistance protein [Aspergillus pseudonomiae]
MSTPQSTITILALLLGMLLTIISTAVPRITHDFHSLNDVGWYGSAFFLTMCVFQTFWGKLYRYCSIKYTFVAAILSFELGTLGCAVSTNSAGFIAGRAVAGFGGAGVISGTYIILAHVVPPEKVPVFYGLNGIIFTVASVAGPLIGGAFTSNVTWRWCFYINLPLGGVALAALLLALHLPRSSRSTATPVLEIISKLDLPGCIVITGALVCYLLALEFGGITKPWGSSQPIGLLVGWILLSLLFAVVEWFQKEEALVASRYLRNHGVLICCVFAFFLNAANYVRVYYLPLYFQAIKNASPARSGILLLAYIVPMSIFTMLAGGLLSKVGYYQPFLLVGAAIVTIGSGLIYTWEINTSSAKIIGYQILAGMGDGICVQIPVTVVQIFVHQKDLATVTALVLFFQLGSGVIGIAAGQSIFSNRVIQSLARYAPGTSPTTVLQAGAAELQAVFGEAEVQGVRRAYLVGIHGAWILNLALCGAAVVVGLLAPRISIVGKTGVQSAPDTDSETNPRPASEMDEKEGEEGGSGGGAR